jgi:hypothetical protein
LDLCSADIAPESKHNTKFCFEITSAIQSRVFILAAENGTSLQEWVEVIRRTMLQLRRERSREETESRRKKRESLAFINSISSNSGEVNNGIYNGANNNVTTNKGFNGFSSLDNNSLDGSTSMHKRASSGLISSGGDTSKMGNSLSTPAWSAPGTVDSPESDQFHWYNQWLEDTKKKSKKNEKSKGGFLLLSDDDTSSPETGASCACCSVM